MTVKISIMKEFKKIEKYQKLGGFWQKMVNYRRCKPRFCQSKSISRYWLEYLRKNAILLVVEVQ